MQLIKVFLCLLFISNTVWAQSSDTSTYVDFSSRKVKSELLIGYYTQDGQHSAVTGGQGTEELQDRDVKIIFHIPVDSLTDLTVNQTINYYTSASTDRIDFKMSSASKEDLRLQTSLKVKQKFKKHQYYTYGAYGSIESDYISASLNGGWGRKYANGSQIGISTNVFFDKWILILPQELRDQPNLFPHTDKRNSWQFHFKYSFIMSKRMRFFSSIDPSLQSGLLSTPFHRVYLQNQSTAVLEKLPSQRIKYPIGIGVTTYLNRLFKLKMWLRYYYDTFGIQGETFTTKLYVTPSLFLTLSPFIRLHHQKGSRYFGAYQENLAVYEYYTSDFDLSDFTSIKYGVGVKYKPLYGLFLSKKSKPLLEQVLFQFSIYRRSDGLNSSLFSIGLIH